MSISEWGKGALVAAFAGFEVALSTSHSKSELLPSSQEVLEKLKELSGERVVLAIGVAQGRIIDETDESTSSKFWIRRGGDFVTVSEPAFRLWLWTLTPRSFDEFQTHAKEVQGSETGFLDHAQELEDLLLITKFGPDPIEWSELAEELRPIPLGFGMGNSRADALGYQIADAIGRPRLRVHPLGFWIWMSWDGTLSIAEAADQLATVIPIDVSRDVILDAAREFLFLCLAFGLIILDAVCDR